LTAVCTKLSQPLLSYGWDPRTVTCTSPSDERLQKFRNRMRRRIL